MAKRIINWLFLRDLLVATVVSFSGISKVTEDTIIGKVSIFSKCVIRCLKHLAKKKRKVNTTKGGEGRAVNFSNQKGSIRGAH